MFKKYSLAALLMFSISVPVFAQTTNTTTPAPIECSGKYALCTSARCLPDPTNPKIAICNCTVQNGNNAGYSTCQKRIPTTDQNNVTYVLSTFSLEELPNKKGMICQSGAWSNCLDQPCTVDPINPNHAICSCPIVTSSAYVTFGGNCDTNTCKTGFWSGATAAEGAILPNFLVKQDKVADTFVACPAK